MHCWLLLKSFHPAPEPETLVDTAVANTSFLLIILLIALPGRVHVDTQAGKISHHAVSLDFLRRLAIAVDYCYCVLLWLLLVFYLLPRTLFLFPLLLLLLLFFPLYPYLHSLPLPPHIPRRLGTLNSINTMATSSKIRSPGEAGMLLRSILRFDHGIYLRIYLWSIPRSSAIANPLFFLNHSGANCISVQ